MRHTHDAEGAFQAPFLVLAEKAHLLCRPELLAKWLYGTAYRTATLHARQRALRCSEREREAAKMIAPSNGPENESEKLRRILDDELYCLPERCRAPLVLCYLDRSPFALLNLTDAALMALVALAKTCRRGPVKYTSVVGFVVVQVVGAFLHEPGGGSLDALPIESEQEECELRLDNVGTATAG